MYLPVRAAWYQAWLRALPLRQRSLQRWLELLSAHARREGHSRVPARHREGNFHLGRWVDKTRTKYKQGQLAPELVVVLERFPGWTWSTNEARFQEGLSHLCRFVKRKGHARVPQEHREGAFDLGTWVATRRRDYEQEGLSPERVRALERLPGWSWNVLEDRFARGLELLRRFARRHGHARVPDGHIEDGFPLGAYVRRHRTRRARGRLSLERARLLERVPGWAWKVFEDRFEKNVSLLRRYRRRERHLRPRQGHREEGVRLWSWIAAQRFLYRHGRLSATRAQTLGRIPGWSWRPQRAEVDSKGLAALRRYAQREGDALVPHGHSEGGFALGWWVAKKRQQHREGVLSAELIRTLSRVPGWLWEPRHARFQEALAALRRFIRREGHSRVPRRHKEDGFPLGTWVRIRRRKHRAGLLPKELARQIQRVRGWDWDPLQA